jgi:cobalamin biosynthesis Mg chelatase CobN
MLFGDTRHTADQPYNVLSGVSKNGLFPRPADQLANLASYGDVLNAYCVATDPICAQGKDVKTHLNYFDVFTDEAADWVKERVKKAGGVAEADEDDKSSSTAAASATTKTKAITVEITTTMASETKATTMVVTKTEASETDDVASSTTDGLSAVVTSLVDAASSIGPAAAEASSTSTDNAAAPTGVPLAGIIMGVAALLAI